MASWLLEESMNKESVLAGTRWKRDRDNTQVHRLISDGGYQFAKVWKYSGSWGALNGNTYSTLKAAKVAAEDYAVSIFGRKVAEFCALLDELQKTPATDPQIHMQSEHHSVLGRLIDERLKSEYASAAIRHGAGDELLPLSSQVSNCLGAISRNGKVLSLLDSRLIFRSGNGFRSVLLDKMEIWATVHRAGEAGRIPWPNGEASGTVLLKGVDDLSIKTAVDTLVSSGIKQLTEDASCVA